MCRVKIELMINPPMMNQLENTHSVNPGIKIHKDLSRCIMISKGCVTQESHLLILLVRFSLV